MYPIPKALMISPNVLMIFPLGGPPNRGNGCAVSTKARLGKISPKNFMPGQKSAQKPNDQDVFMKFRVPKLEFFIKLRSLFHSFIKYYTILSKIAKNLMPG